MNKDPAKRATVDQLLYNDEFIAKGMPWLQERILWIGFIKNKKNSACIIKQLPKDILLLIIQFFKLN